MKHTCQKCEGKKELSCKKGKYVCPYCNGLGQVENCHIAGCKEPVVPSTVRMTVCKEHWKNSGTMPLVGGKVVLPLPNPLPYRKEN